MKKALILLMALAEQVYANPWARSLTLVDQAIKYVHPNRKIVIAVIDTGVDTSHEKLKNNIWVNSGEVGLDSNGNDKSTNKIDDDGNGCVDDVQGWNFHAQTNKVEDLHGHGTHVSGIILGITSKNDQPIREVTIMPLKYIEPSSNIANTLSSSIQAFEYAIRMGANIINYSAGGAEFSAQEKAVVQKAKDKGILVVAAAGNESQNADKIPYYPASYNLSNIISVTAVDDRASLIPVANYGFDNVHLAAPGYKIFSSLPQNKYGYMTGTSQATAYVTGVAALLAMQTQGEFHAEAIREKLLSAAREEDQLIGLNHTGSVVDALLAVTQEDQGINVRGVASFSFEPQKYFSSNVEEVFEAHKNLIPNKAKIISQK